MEEPTLADILEQPTTEVLVESVKTKRKCSEKQLLALAINRAKRAAVFQEQKNALKT